MTYHNFEKSSVDRHPLSQQWVGLDETISSWDGEKVVNSSEFEVFYNLASPIYRVDIFIDLENTKKIYMSEDHGFWLDGHEEVKVSGAVPGKTKVYVLENGVPQLRLIKNVIKQKGGLILPDIIGSEHKNYIVDDVILHNFDMEDYRVSGVIGVNPGFYEVPCTIWEDMWVTARATWDAHLKGVQELIFAANEVRCTIKPESPEVLDYLAKVQEIVIDKYFKQCIPRAYARRQEFFNSLACNPPGDKQLGTVTQVFQHPTLDVFTENTFPPYGSFDVNRFVFLGDSINYDIEYGDGIFSEQRWLDYQEAFKDYICCLREALEIVGVKFEFGEGYVGAPDKDNFVAHDYNDPSIRIPEL